MEGGGVLGPLDSLHAHRGAHVHLAAGCGQGGRALLVPFPPAEARACTASADAHLFCIALCQSMALQATDSRQPPRSEEIERSQRSTALERRGIFRRHAGFKREKNWGFIAEGDALLVYYSLPALHRGAAVRSGRGGRPGHALARLPRAAGCRRGARDRSAPAHPRMRAASAQGQEDNAWPTIKLALRTGLQQWVWWVVWARFLRLAGGSQPCALCRPGHGQV